VLSAEELDSNDMVVDFKAIKLLCQEHIERYDHRMALNSNDPLLDAMQSVHPDSVLVFENMDPTTEVVAREIFDYVSNGLREGLDRDGYRIETGRVLLERVRVTETPSSWAEYRV
jgi:6-pyruvoyltetrahydropterin/6-carboxytetrahydropterin synthase